MYSCIHHAAAVHDLDSKEKETKLEKDRAGWQLRTRKRHLGSLDHEGQH